MLDLDLKTQRALDAFSQSHWIEPLLKRPELTAKRMFGGLAIYLGETLVIVLMESGEDNRTWKGVNFGFGIWNGILIPTSREHHRTILRDFPGLIPHPVLAKWLYLPMSHDHYESYTPKIVRFIAKGDERFGVLGGTRNRKTGVRH